MVPYKANSTNLRNFSLTRNKETVGELIYKKWYSFTAEILMPDGAKYGLEPKGFWESKIELKDGDTTLLEFKMGWRGIVIKTFLANKEASFLLKASGLLSRKFVLLNTDKEELLAAEADFKWSKFNYDYTIETTEAFERFDQKEALLLTILHCINYYMTMIAAAA